MAALKAVIAEDEPVLRGELRDTLARIWPELVVCAEAEDGTFTLGVRNALDKTAPLSNQSFAFQRGLDPSYADPRGRIFYAALRCAFD
jgi:iron complex outermembrane receptor protein